MYHTSLGNLWCEATKENNFHSTMRLAFLTLIIRMNPIGRPHVSLFVPHYNFVETYVYTDRVGLTSDMTIILHFEEGMYTYCQSWCPHVFPPVLYCFCNIFPFARMIFRDNLNAALPLSVTWFKQPNNIEIKFTFTLQITRSFWTCKQIIIIIIIIIAIWTGHSVILYTQYKQLNILYSYCEEP
jgi:hypothetical protein